MEKTQLSTSNEGMRELGRFGCFSGPSGVRAASAATGGRVAIGRN